MRGRGGGFGERRDVNLNRKCVKRLAVQSLYQDTERRQAVQSNSTWFRESLNNFSVDRRLDQQRVPGDQPGPSTFVPGTFM